MMTNREKQKILAKRVSARSDFAKDFIDSVGDELFYDQFIGEFFKSNKAAILGAELALNRELNQNGIVSIEKFYDMLGIGPFAIKPRCGWAIEINTNWIDIDKIYLEDDQYVPTPYHLLAFIPEPEVL